MHKKIFNALTLFNLIGQAIYTLCLPIGLGALISYLLTKYASAPRWIWAIFLTVGSLMGLYSMIKFILSATASMDRLEKQQKRDLAEKKEKEERQARLRRAAGDTEENND